VRCTAAALERFALSHFLTLALTVIETAAAPVEPLLTAACVHFGGCLKTGRFHAR
jgi:hypothetical protein